MRARRRPGTVRGMRLFVALLGLLLLAPAASAATPVYKVSAYGVQRITTTSTATATGQCFDERGSQRTEVVVRFKTPQALRARFMVIGPVATLIPIGNRELRLTGTIERKISSDLEHASCSNLNPDGSPRWVPTEVPESCSRSFDDYTASLAFDGRTARFGAQQPELASLTCVNADIASVKKRVSLRQVVQSKDTPIRIQTSSQSTEAAPDGSSSATTTSLTTVYIQFRQIG
jgi:hypothetical protein